PMSNLRHKLTLLAYEMNDEPLRVMHGAPLRLRCENELGFRMVKWLAAIEFVNDYADLGAGQGGYNDDHEVDGHRMPIGTERCSKARHGLPSGARVTAVPTRQRVVRPVSRRGLAGLIRETGTK